MSKKIVFNLYQKNATEGKIEQEYNLETGEIEFRGKIKINRNTKDGKRIFYYSFIDQIPIISYFFNKKTYRKQGTEKEEANRKVKEIFNIDID